MTSNGRTRIVTSRLGLARALWFYGEDDLWPPVLDMTPEWLAGVGDMAGEMFSVETQERWGRRLTADAALVMAAIRVIEGQDRRPARTRRRPEKQIPARLAATVEQRWADPDLARVADAGRAGGPEDTGRG